MCGFQGSGIFPLDWRLKTDEHTGRHAVFYEQCVTPETLCMCGVTPDIAQDCVVLRHVLWRVVRVVRPFFLGFFCASIEERRHAEERCPCAGGRKRDAHAFGETEGLADIA